MERYRIYKFGIAILVYVVFFKSPAVINAGDVIRERPKRTPGDELVYYQGVQGDPGVDFPVFAYIPKTQFSCKEVESGYYADLETDCQVFHICNERKKVSFLCPNGTIFQQRDLICDWWFKVNCTDSPNLYEESAEILHQENLKRKSMRRVKYGTVSEQNIQTLPARKAESSHRGRGNEDRRVNDLVRENRPVQGTEGIRKITTQTLPQPFSLQRQSNQNYEDQRVNNLVREDRPIQETEGNRKVEAQTASQSFSGQRQNNRNYDRRVNNAIVQNGPTVRPQSGRNDIIRGDRKFEASLRQTARKPSSEDFDHETQITQETASFYKNNFNNIQQSTKQTTANPYPNHKVTYTPLQDPRYYYTKPTGNKLFENPFTTQTHTTVTTDKEGLNVLHSTTSRTLPFGSETGTSRGSKTFGDAFYSLSPNAVTPTTDSNIYKIRVSNSVSNQEGNFGVSSTTSPGYVDTTSDNRNSKSYTPSINSQKQQNNDNVVFIKVKPPVTSFKTQSGVSSTFGNSAPTKNTFGDNNSRISLTVSSNLATSNFNNTERVGGNKYLPESGVDKTTIYGTHQSSVDIQKLHSRGSKRYEFGNKFSNSEILPPKEVHDGPSSTPNILRVDVTAKPREQLPSRLSDVTPSTPTNFYQNKISINDQGYSVTGSASPTSVFITDQFKQLNERLPLNSKLNQSTFEVIPPKISDILLFSKSSSEKSNVPDSFTDGLSGIQFNIPIIQTPQVEVKAHNVNKPLFTTPEPSLVNVKFRGNAISSTVATNEIDSGSTEGLEGYTNTDKESSSNGFFVTKSGIVKPEVVRITSTVAPFSLPEGFKKSPHVSSLQSSSPSISKFSPDHNETVQFASTGSHVSQPKPFFAQTTTVPNLLSTRFDDSKTSSLGPYQISSANPFTNSVNVQITTTDKKLSGTGGIAIPEPTLPTPFTTKPLSSKVVDENVNNMLNTLTSIVNQGPDVTKEDDFANPRPGLVIPPSAGPQTLHTLALYFANALDDIAGSSDDSSTESEMEAEQDSTDDTAAINSLLTRSTISRYKELFNEDATDQPEINTFPSRIGDTEIGDKNDLNAEHSSNPIQTTPRVRQLARVFTEALSAYLDDPATFRKVLQEVRPTEPPAISNMDEAVVTEEDEVLNYSDADIKHARPSHIPTPVPNLPDVNPTWGYILAFNKSDNNDLENLQPADSQSFIPRFNNVLGDTRKIAASTVATPVVTTFGSESLSKEITTENPSDKDLPVNHWTTSSDVAKLWKSTFSVNPEAVNEHLNITTIEENISSKEYFGSTEDSVYDEKSLDSSFPFTQSGEINYELRSFPKIESNMTAVRGILIDFMNSTQSDGAQKLHRILEKLNMTEHEFLAKMREIEENPLTRRLILLLINECDSNKTREFETRAAPVPNILSLAQEKSDALQISSSNVASVSLPRAKVPNQFQKIVDPSLENNDHDTRALELLNSLYVIASKFGK